MIINNPSDAEYRTSLPPTITLRVWTESGDHWITGFNGTLQEATDYYVGQWFNIGLGGEDRMERVTRIEQLGKKD